MESFVDNLEEMGAFFDARHDSYDDHMRNTVVDFEAFYEKITTPVTADRELVRILDLGCGTGLELKSLLPKENILVTCIDLSPQMLKRLEQKYQKYRNKLTLIKGSYFEMPFGEAGFHYAISVMTLHHVLHDKKRALYHNIRKALKPGGLYIEGDYIVAPDREQEFIATYQKRVPLGDSADEGKYHIDLPFSLDTQIRLLLEAGFASVEVIWVKGETAILVSKT